ncbi:MAG: Gfo/Idh/MocA family oxidoreductase [Bryobacterales bacterium]|nr:Gfo/Idh/MocA family oxidoreductase [Bryobacterales bacterium]
MQRRTFTKILGAGATLAAQRSKAMTEPIEVGVITHAGGAHLGAYFSALADTPEVNRVVLSDEGGENTAAARSALGAKLAAAYSTPQEMFSREKPVMALVSMEAGLAPPAIEAALEAGCHVMSEKPSCVRVEDFEKLVEKANEAGRHLMLALANRLNPEVREARRLIQQGKIGKIYGVELHLIADQTRLTRPEYHERWYAQKARAGGGHLIWLGIHWLDLAMFLTGLRIADVAGFAGNVGGQPIDVEDSAAVALRFENGVFGTIISGYYLDKGYHSHIKIWGSEGWLQIERHGGLPLQWYSQGEEQPRVHRVEIFDGPSGYTPFVKACVRASAGLDRAPLSSDDSLRVLKTVFASYRAAETGRRQTIT